MPNFLHINIFFRSPCVGPGVGASLGAGVGPSLGTGIGGGPELTKGRQQSTSQSATTTKECPAIASATRYDHNVPRVFRSAATISTPNTVFTSQMERKTVQSPDFNKPRIVQQVVLTHVVSHVIFTFAPFYEASNSNKFSCTLSFSTMNV